MAPDCDLVLVAGSATSSNSTRLVEVALAHGARRAHLVDSHYDIDETWLTDTETVGLTSRASVPEYVVDAIRRYLYSHGYRHIEHIVAATEGQRFAPPRELHQPQPPSR